VSIHAGEKNWPTSSSGCCWYIVSQRALSSLAVSTWRLVNHLGHRRSPGARPTGSSTSAFIDVDACAGVREVALQEPGRVVVGHALHDADDLAVSESHRLKGKPFTVPSRGLLCTAVPVAVFRGSVAGDSCTDPRRKSRGLNELQQCLFPKWNQSLRLVRCRESVGGTRPRLRSCGRPRRSARTRPCRCASTRASPVRPDGRWLPRGRRC